MVVVHCLVIVAFLCSKMAETKGSEKVGWAAAAAGLPFALGFKMPAEKHTPDKAQDKGRDKDDSRRPTKDEKRD